MPNFKSISERVLDYPPEAAACRQVLPYSSNTFMSLSTESFTQAVM